MLYSWEHEEVVPFELDFEDWLERGSGGSSVRSLIERTLTERPKGTDCFRVVGRAEARVLELQIWLAHWRKRGE